MFKVTLLSPPKSFPHSFSPSPTLNPVLSHPVLPSSFCSSFHLNFSLMSSSPSSPSLFSHPLSPFVSVRFFLCKDNVNHMRVERGNAPTAADMYVTNSVCLCRRHLFLARVLPSLDWISDFPGGQQRGEQESRRSLVPLWYSPWKNKSLFGGIFFYGSAWSAP